MKSGIRSFRSMVIVFQVLDVISLRTRNLFNRFVLFPAKDRNDSVLGTKRLWNEMTVNLKSNSI